MAGGCAAYTFYYLDRNEQYTFVLGKVVDYGPIDSERRAELLRLVSAFKSKP